MNYILTLWIALVCLSLGGSPNTPAIERAPDKLQEAAGTIVEQLLTGKRKLHVGMKIKPAIKAFKSAANVAVGQHMPLGDTPLAPRGKWNGVVSAIIDPDKDTELDQLSVTLLCDKYDKGKMGRFLIEAAKEFGMELEQDGDDATLYYNSNEVERDLYVGLGDGIIAFECDLADN